MSRSRRFPSFRGQRPPHGAVLDRTHPLAQGLKIAYLFNEQTGEMSHFAFDSCGNANATVSYGTSEVALASEGMDNRLNIDGGIGTDPDVTGPLSDLVDISEFTAVVSLEPYGLDTGYKTVLDLGSSSNKRIWIGFVSLRMAFWSNVDSTYYGRGAGSQYAAGDVHTYALRNDQWRGRTIFENGLQRRGVGYGNSHSGSLSADARFTVGRTFQFGGYYCPGIYHYVYLYDRALSDDEIANLYANPYQMFKVSSEVVVEPAGRTTTIEVPAAELSLSTAIPSVSAPYEVLCEPAASQLSATGHGVTVAADSSVQVSPATGSVVAPTAEATVVKTQHVWLDVAAAVVGIAGLLATAVTPVTVQADTGTLQTSSTAAMVQRSSHVEVWPGSAVVETSVFVPEVAVSRNKWEQVATAVLELQPGASVAFAGKRYLVEPASAASNLLPGETVLVADAVQAVASGNLSIFGEDVAAYQWKLLHGPVDVASELLSFRSFAPNGRTFVSAAESLFYEASLANTVELKARLVNAVLLRGGITTVLGRKSPLA